MSDEELKASINRPHEIRVGGRVRIKDVLERVERDPGVNTTMEEMQGKIYTVKRIEDTSYGGDRRIRLQDGGCIWIERWLEPID